jgi:hypothetical protein
MLRSTVLVLAFLLVLTVPGVALAQAESFTEVEQFPINFIRGGCEEPIELSGTLHSVFHITTDDSGGVHVVSKTNPQGVTGVGLVTGTKYQGTGVTRSNFNGQVGSASTFVNSFKIIGQGTADNYLVQNSFHITVNANGEVTAVANNFFVKCQG